MAIHLEQVRLGYADKIIINDISLHIPKGSFCSIIGPNGCGKSTLLKAISRNLPKIFGTISIDNKKLEHYETKKLARKLAFLAQAPHVPDQFTVRELVSYGRYPYINWLGTLTSSDNDIINRSMELTGVRSFENRDLARLSGGERQRVWIAMALAQEAEILLLDEPTTYLDISHQFQTLELIRQLNREMKRTILMVLHDLNQAARYSDFIFVMKNGALVEQGTPDKIINTSILRNVFSIEARILRDTDHQCPLFIPIQGVPEDEQELSGRVI